MTAEAHVEPVRFSLPEIEQFTAVYRRQYLRFADAAQQVEAAVRDALRDAAIRPFPIVSSRAKHPDDFSRKLQNVDPPADGRHKYVGRKRDLRDDPGAVLSDLAGCRVIAYLPQHIDEIRRALTQRFAISPGAWKHKSEDRYEAWHVVIDVEPKDRTIGLPTASCEIQVATIARHVQNEVQHDITYKHHFGTPSAEMQAALGALDSVLRIVDEKLNEVFHLRSFDAETTRRRDRPIDSPETLRDEFALAARNRVSGDFGPLFRLLSTVTEQLTANRLQLDRFAEIRGRGKDRLRDEMSVDDADDVLCFAFGSDELLTTLADVAADLDDPADQGSRLARCLRDWKKRGEAPVTSDDTRDRQG